MIAKVGWYKDIEGVWTVLLLMKTVQKWLTSCCGRGGGGRGGQPRIKVLLGPNLHNVGHSGLKGKLLRLQSGAFNTPIELLTDPTFHFYICFLPEFVKMDIKLHRTSINLYYHLESINWIINILFYVIYYFIISKLLWFYKQN